MYVKSVYPSHRFYRNKMFLINKLHWPQIMAHAPLVVHRGIAWLILIE